MREQFMLDTEVVFLNHGSFGATPRPVFEVYQEWQRRLEAQPVRFLGREIHGHLAATRHRLGDYLQVNGDDLVFIPNATYGVNVVARSLDLRPGDEVLTTNHEYGACMKAWQFLSRKKGFTLLTQPIPLPITDAESMIEQFWAGVTSRTRVIYLSHITSATAQTFPVTEICSRARVAGILTLVDGAHAPGQVPLNLASIGADFYTGNAHKWLCNPKGAGFLYTRPENQYLVEPLIVGWGWESEPGHSTGSTYLDNLEWCGTNDLSAYLTVPAAIAFQEAHNWPAVQHHCQQLLREALAAVDSLTGLPTVYPDGSRYYQMAIARLPVGIDPRLLQTRLYDQFRVEIPCYPWEDQNFLRLSIQAYNSGRDIDCLLHALRSLL